MFRFVFALIISISQLFPRVFDKDEEVRAFRSWAKWNKPGANVAKEGEYEALDILNFIADKGLTGSALPPDLLQNRDQKQYLISIAQSILQGRGFDQGVTNQPVKTGDMTKYRDTVATIGQHINRTSAALVSAEIFNTIPGTHIAEHVRIANELLISKAPIPSPAEPLYTREGFIKSEAARRDATFWRYARADGDVSGLCGDVRCYTTDITERGYLPLIFPLKRRSSQQVQGAYPTTAIHYNVYISDTIERGLVSPKGVIVTVYGSGTKQSAKRVADTSLECIMAHHGYIVYALNVRGTHGFGDEYLKAQGGAAGVDSLARDVSYFIQMTQRVPDGPEPNTEADYSRYPKFSRLIKGKNLVTALTGASFGGYMTMLTSTHGENFNTWDLDGQTFSYDHNQSYDAFIPVMGVSDQRADMQSGTLASQGRYMVGQFNVNAAGAGSWMANAFHGLDILGNDAHNQRICPLFRIGLIQRPMLIMHGIADVNVSPRQSLQFIASAIAAGKGNLIAAYFDRYMGHNYPAGASIKAYYETILRFMDSVMWAKQQKVPFAFSAQEQQSTIVVKDTAWFLMRAENPDIGYAYKKYILELMKEYKRVIGTVYNEKEAWRIWNSAKENNTPLGILYISALLAHKADELVRGTERDLDKIPMPIRKSRDAWRKRAMVDLHLDISAPHVTSIKPIEFLNFQTSYLISTQASWGATMDVPFYSASVLQYYMQTTNPAAPPGIHPETGLVHGVDTSLAPAFQIYDQAMAGDFIETLKKTYLLDNLDKTILRTSLYDF